MTTDDPMGDWEITPERRALLERARAKQPSYHLVNGRTCDDLDCGVDHDRST